MQLSVVRLAHLAIFYLEPIEADGLDRGVWGDGGVECWGCWNNVSLISRLFLS